MEDIRRVPVLGLVLIVGTAIELSPSLGPRKPYFSMSVNKLQGQTIKVIGLELFVPCFTHRQFYVDVSLACNRSKLSMLVPNNQGHWIGALCPMFHPSPVLCGCLSSLQQIQA